MRIDVVVIEDDVEVVFAVMGLVVVSVVDVLERVVELVDPVVLVEESDVDVVDAVERSDVVESVVLAVVSIVESNVDVVEVKFVEFTVVFWAWIGFSKIKARRANASKSAR